MVYKKIIYISYLMIFVVMIAVLGNFIIPKTHSTSGRIGTNNKVIIDAGHGGLTNTIKA